VLGPRPKTLYRCPCNWTLLSITGSARVTPGVAAAMETARAPNGAAPLPESASIWNRSALWNAAVADATESPRPKSAIASPTAMVTCAIVAAVRRLRRSVLRTPMRAGPDRSWVLARMRSRRPVP
jgi:hypothetical protein